MKEWIKMIEVMKIKSRIGSSIINLTPHSQKIKHYNLYNILLYYTINI
jgi:hypothetical protein